MKEEIEGNDPCPCGSGKKYKHCCLNETNLEDEMNPGQQVFEMIREKLDGQEFHSLEDARDFLNLFMVKKNQAAQLDFLGLSSEQMHRMLHSPMEEVEDIVTWNHLLEAEAFQNIPVVKDCIFFLSRLSELEPLKATKKGNLPLELAQELQNNFFQPTERYQFRIRSEQEAISVLSLRHILSMSGWIKKQKSHFQLTVKGKKLLTHGLTAPEFSSLVKVFTRKFNWGFQDRYPGLRIIQDGYLFSLYLLYRRAEDFVEDRDLGASFIRAFPQVVSEVKTATFREPADTVKRCFSVRFLERFCEYFGLVESKREKLVPFGYRLFVKKSDFFNNYFVWKRPQARH